MSETISGRDAFINRFEQVCNGSPGKTAVTYLLDGGGEKLFSYSQLRGQAKTLAEALRQTGLHTGDRVALISVLSPYCYIAYFAFAYAGLTAVIIDPQLPEQEKDRLLSNADIRGIMASEAVYEDYANRFDAQMPVLHIESAAAYRSNVPLPALSATPDPDIEAAAVLYSSGTTSQAKGVVIGFEQQLNAVATDLEFVGTNDIRWLEVYPFFHISGLSSSLAILLNGAEIGLIENVTPVKLQQAFQQYRPNTFALVPRVFDLFGEKIREAVSEKGALVKNIIFALMRFCGFTRKHFNLNPGKHVFKSINKQLFGGRMIFLGVGGGLSNPKTLEFFYRLGYMWFNMYASTEANVPITSTTYMDKYPIGSSGRIDRFPNIQIKIHNPNETGVGEILVKSDLLMRGYFREPELTAAAFDEQGYFKTGDLGYVNKKNELMISGRAKEAIYLHNGEKVSPDDIERVYADVCGAAAFSCAGVTGGDGVFETAQLFVEKGEMSNDETEDFKKRVLTYSAKLGSNYQVSRIHFIDKLPVTSVGKVKRFQLKEIALAEQER